MDKVFWGLTLCPCNNANYLIHERILHIYRSRIHFSIRTDGQLRFTDGELVYHRYRPYRWTRFLGATLCPCNNANYLIHERIFAHLPIVYSFLHPYRRTTSIYRWKIGLPSVPTVPMDKVFGGLPYGLAIMLSTSFNERILYIYRSCIHFYMRTDGQLRFTDEELV